MQESFSFGVERLTDLAVLIIALVTVTLLVLETIYFVIVTLYLASRQAASPQQHARASEGWKSDARYTSSTSRNTAEQAMKHFTVTCLAALLTLAVGSPVLAQGGNDLFQQALRKERVDGDLKSAIALYQRILKEQAADRPLCAKTLVQLGQAHEKMGNADAMNSYQRVIREYADQSEQVTVARARLGALSAGGRAATGESSLAVRRVSQGVDLTGQVSPEGRFLSFTDWEANGNLAVRDLGTGQNRLLTDLGKLPFGRGGYAEYSIPSPDSRSVVYSWVTPNRPADLCVVGLDGSKPRVLRTPGDDVSTYVPIAWSPDSRQLLVEAMRTDGTRDMMLMTIADGSTRLLKAMGKVRSPGGVFSPDGQYIAWATAEGFSLFHVSTGAESPLIPDGSRHSVLGWTSDGRHVLFSSARSGSSDAWLVAVDRGKALGEPVFVKKNWGSIPIGLTRTGAFYYGVNNNVWEVRIADVDSTRDLVGAQQQVTSRHGNTRNADWSPDGRDLAFMALHGSSQTVVVRSMETGEEREFEVGERAIWGTLRWTRDGKAIVIPTTVAGKGDYLLRVDVQTGQLSDLTALPANFGRFEFSPDGNTIFYVNYLAPSDPAGVRLVARDLRSGQETLVIEKRGLYAGVVSPDGQRLLLATWDGKSRMLFVMPVSGGQPREVARLEADYGGAPSWTPDGQSVAFVKTVKGQPGQWEIWRASVEHGEQQRIGLIAARQLQAVRLHPDGRRVAVTDVKVNLELWVMENFLPRAGTPAKGR